MGARIVFPPQSRTLMRACQTLRCRLFLTVLATMHLQANTCTKSYGATLVAAGGNGLVAWVQQLSNCAKKISPELLMTLYHTSSPPQRSRQWFNVPWAPTLLRSRTQSPTGSQRMGVPSARTTSRSPLPAALRPSLMGRTASTWPLTRRPTPLK